MGSWCRNAWWGGFGTFFTTLQFSLIAFIFSVFESPMQYFHPHSHPTLLLKLGIICTFLIHSGLFNLVRITQKTKWTVFIEYQGKAFLSIEKILQKISQHQPSPHLWDKSVAFLLSYNLRNIIKKNWH